MIKEFETMKTWEKIIILILFSIPIILIAFLVGIVSVNAQAINTELYISNTKMTGNNKLYNSGAQNVTIQIREESNTLYNTSKYQYGYIAICSATGKDNPITTMSYNTGYINNAIVYMSNESCTIPTTNAYSETARILYITYYADIQSLYSQDANGNYYYLNNPTFTIYQGNSTEYGLVGYGFSNSPYRVNSEASLYDQILNSIQQALTTINGSIIFLQQKIDITNGKIDIVNGKLDITNTRISTIIDIINAMREEEEERQKVCNIVDIEQANEQGYLGNDGIVYESSSAKTTNFINIENVNEIEMIEENPGNLRICFYDNNKENISCTRSTTITTINVPNKTKYMKVSINITTKKPIYKYCKNGNQAISDKQEEIINYGEDVEPDEPSEDIQEANENEEDLLSNIEEIDLSSEIEIDLEQNSTNWVWTQLTNILQTNAKIFGLIISTLVLGVIKTILGR